LDAKNSPMDIPGRVASVLDKIGESCHQAGRSEDEVCLVAVTKRIGLDLVVAACQAGLRNLGENRVLDALSRQNELPVRLAQAGLSADDIRWHFIGHLQSNKAGKASGGFVLNHGVDSAKLARRLAGLAHDCGRTEPILLEINAANEPQKHGIKPDELSDTLAELGSLPGLDIQGLMCMGRQGASGMELHETFAQVRRLCENARHESGLPLPHLSMGMSGDYEIAIAEGATLVRVGGAIFGPRSL
jgi:PLP dependent protein